MSAIITLTPSAAIDQTYYLNTFVVGEVNRAGTSHVELSGKGVNVAHAISLAGLPVRAVLALGQDDESWAVSARDYLRPVFVPGPTRVNTSVIDARGTTTKINQAPIPLTAAQWSSLREATLGEITELGATWCVVCGSIPQSAETEALVPITEVLRACADRGVFTAMDSSGPGLRQALESGIPIDLIKPNTHELAELVGRSLLTIGDVIEAATAVHRGGIRIVYVSMGADGALAVSAAGVHWARSEPRAIVNSVGAGDASLAGFLTGLVATPGPPDSPAAISAALGRAAAWGALAVSQQTTLLSGGDRAPLAEVVSDPDRGVLLEDPARCPTAPPPPPTESESR